MKFKFILIFFIFLSSTVYAGTLKKCEGVMTPQGYKYVGTYCYDYSCSYTYTKVFSSYCPYYD